MPAAFPAPPGKFVGRNAYIARFQSRVEHFPLFIYGGIPGIGKTSLVLRLAKEARRVGATRSIYLALTPGEGINSLLARVEARLKARSAAGTERQGDPFTRLCDLLDARKTVLVLDDLQHLRREDLSPLLRILRSRDRETRFRILAACRGDLDLPAIDRTALILEKVGGLTVEEVKKIATSRRLSGEPLERLLDDAQRGGAVCQPLTLLVMLALLGSNVPAEEALRVQSSRSVNAFKLLLGDHLEALPEVERNTLAALGRVGLPVAKPVAVRAFGTVIDKLVKKNLLDVVDGEVYVHYLVGQLVGTQGPLTTQATKVVAKHLETHAIANSEPLGIIRAGELLAHAGQLNAAVDTLAEGWEDIRDLGFFEAFLKTLAFIPESGALKPRLDLLAARARMRKDEPHRVTEEMERLAGQKDPWTRMRAHAALTYIYSHAGRHKDVLKSFAALRKSTNKAGLVVPAGSLAAESMVRLGKVGEAEKLAKSLLTKLRNKKQPDREGELHRLLARIYAQSGRLQDAVHEAQLAAKDFETSGDLYHAATAQGFIGDLYRETGDFELAKEAFERFNELAEAWGDRNLVQIADLADAWVSLDIGDLPHAAKQIDRVEKEMSAAPSRRLRRYLAAARALLEAGRGHHAAAAAALPRVVESWEHAGQRAIADVLRAQLVRSLIAVDKLDDAEKLVRKTLGRLDANTAAPRLASFLRESALIRLRRKDVKKAMAELGQARKLFAKGGNRREEALTLHRIAHAALNEGDIDLAERSAKEAVALARRIKHNRAVALAREMQGRVALHKDKPADAIKAIKEALQALRKLGDDVGTLHVSESLLRAYIVGGDLAAAIRLGPRVREHAEKLEIRDIRTRAIILSGIALLRRNRIDPASRCFRELPEGAVPAETEALMWRLGQALAAVAGESSKAAERRSRWVRAIRRLPDGRQAQAVHGLEQLALPPRERAEVRQRGHKEIRSGEYVAYLNPADYDVLIDLLGGRLTAGGEPFRIGDKVELKVFRRLLLACPRQLPFSELASVALGSAADKDKGHKQLKAVLKNLDKSLKPAKNLKLTLGATGAKLTLPAKHVLVFPLVTVAEVSSEQRKLLKLLARFGALPLQRVQEELGLTRAAARRELGKLMEQGIVEAVRDGRGQAFRLS